MRRALTIALILVLVFAAAVLAGFWGAARLAPERVRLVAERQLGRVLRGQVTLASLEIARARTLPWLWLEARGARAVMQNDVTLLVGRVRARLDPLSLALGRLGLADLRLEDVIVMFPPHPDDPSRPERDRVEKILRPIELTGRFLRRHPCAIPDLSVEGLTLLVTRDGMLDVLLERGTGALACAGFGRDRSSARLVADVRRGEASFPAAFALNVSGDDAAADARFEGAPLATLLAAVELDVPLEGAVTGTVRLGAPAEGPYQLDVSVEGRGVAGPLPNAEAPWLALDLPAPRLRGRLLATPERLALEATQLSDGAVRVSVSGELGVPARPQAYARVRAELGALAMTDLPHLLAQLPPAPRDDVERALVRLEGGRFTAVSAELAGTLGQLGETLRESVLAHPGALRVEAGLDAATVRLAEGDRASGVAANVVFAGDHLALNVTRGVYHQRPLPQLQFTLHGIENVRSFEEFNCREPQPQPALDGLPRLQEWLAEERKGEGPEERSSTDWQRLSLELDWISHPALLCSLEQVDAVLTPSQEGFRFQLGRGVWAGLPVELDGRWRRGTRTAPRSAVAIEARLGPPFEGMNLDPPAQPWLSGRYAFDATRLGRWHVRGATGRVTANGSRLDLPGTKLELSPGGEVEGNLGVDLGKADTVPFRAEAQFGGVDLHQLWRAADFERGALGGTLLGAGAIEGQLRPGLNPLGDAKGLLALHARNGRIHRKIPIMVAVALASQEFNPFGDREELPYDAIDAVARVENGKLVFDNVQVHAPTLRMGLTGDGQVIDPYELQGVIGLFFFPGLDSLIDRVPILNRVILGQNGNFVGAYFAVTGRWGEPQASLIPMQTIATGPAGFLTEGIPGFVRGGIKRLQSVILPNEEAAARPEEGTADS